MDVDRFYDDDEHFSCASKWSSTDTYIHSVFTYIVCMLTSSVVMMSSSVVLANSAYRHLYPLFYFTDCVLTGSASAQIGTCDTDQFKCANKMCIPASKVCNNVQDCDDSSDENGCRKYTSSSTSSAGLFREMVRLADVCSVFLMKFLSGIEGTVHFHFELVNYS